MPTKCFDFNVYKQANVKIVITVVPTKIDSDEILCLQLLIKTLTYTPHFSLREMIDNLCINPILRRTFFQFYFYFYLFIGTIEKKYDDGVRTRSLPDASTMLRLSICGWHVYITFQI